ncbi:MAG: Fic family protein [Candidatus Nanopelagicales bacterium]
MGAVPQQPDEAPTSASSPYIDPSTGFLRNEVSASTQEEIEAAADELLPGRLADLVDEPIPCTGDREHLQAIHRLLFEGIFDWAGQFRTTDIDKQGTDFVPAAEVDSALAELFAELGAEDLLRGLPREQFIARLAHHYARLNQIHPFREGNGRTQRMFWSQVGLNAGWRVDFLSIPKEANNEASRDASHTGDLEPLIEMLDSLTSPAPSVEKGEAQVRSSVRRKQRGRRISGWLKAHANPTRMD